jgi:protein-disulfide isomerase
MSRFMIAAVALIVMALGGWFIARPSTSVGSSTGVELTTETALRGAAYAQQADVDTSSITEMQMGDPDAPVTVIEYASYTCPHCATFHATNFERLKSEYIDTGKVNFIYREVYFDRFGLWASMIARCAERPQTFFGLTSLIYEQQREWVSAGEPVAVAEELRRIGRLAGLDNDTMNQCLQDATKAQTLVAWYEKNAEEHGITSTPSFVINGTRYQNMSWEEMSQLIDDAAG